MYWDGRPRLFYLNYVRLRLLDGTRELVAKYPNLQGINRPFQVSIDGVHTSCFGMT